MWLQLGVVAVAAGVYLLLRRVDRVSGTQARALVDEGARLVDVRTREEFDDEHIEGAVNIPLAELGDRLGELGDKAGDIVVYCRSGMRSARAKKLLAMHGFSAVHDLGGRNRWQ